MKLSRACKHPWDKVRFMRVLNGTVTISVSAHCECGFHLDMSGKMETGTLGIFTITETETTATNWANSATAQVDII